MRQLSGHDASFLYSDSTRANSNVTLIRLRSSTAPGASAFQKHRAIEVMDVRQFFAALLHAPLELDYALIEDEILIWNTTSVMSHCPSPAIGGNFAFRLPESTPVRLI
jgi:hypothetical protein